MDYDVIIKAIEEFEAKSPDEIRDELIEIIESWKDFNLKYLAQQANIKPATLYQIQKRGVRYRTSFTTYIRLKAVGKNVYAE